MSWQDAKSGGGSGGGVDPSDAMLKSEYDTNDNGIVDKAERIEDTVILSEDVTGGCLVYITQAPSSPEGFASVGLADAYDPARRPAVGIALSSGVVGDQITILEYGLAEGIDTSNYTNNDVVFLDRVGNFGTVPNAEYAEQVGTVYEAGVNGSIIFQRGSIDTSGVKWSYSTQAGADTVYETTVSGAASRAIITQEVGSDRPQAKNYLIFNDDVVTQPILVDTLINPAYTITPTESNEILGFVIKPAADQTNVILSVVKNSDVVWRQNIGDITNGVDKVIDMTTGSLVPIDVSEVAVNYDVSFLSNDGDVQLLGDSISGKPYYRATFWEYELVDLVSSTVPIARENLLQAASVAVSQQPVAVDTPLQIEFGPQQGTALDAVEIDALGNISINQSDNYIFDLSLQYGRTGGAGTSVLYARVLVDGAQVGSSGHALVDDGDVIVPTSNEINLTLTAGQVVTFELIRDSSGNNTGGLFQGDPVLAGWNNSPSAEVGVTRFTGQGVILPTQGDVTGPASSTQNELASYANATGKEIKASSDFTAEAGVLKRISAGTTSYRHSNGFNKIDLTGTTAKIVAKNGAGNNTTTLTVSDSNGVQYGGSAMNVDSGSSSVGYKASVGNSFRCQMYWNQAENKTHFSHRGTNSNPDNDMSMTSSNTVWDFSGTKAMRIDNTGHMDVSGVSPEINLQQDGTSKYTWESVSGTMRLGVTGFASTSAYLNFESGFATMIGGDTGWSRLVSGAAEVKADGTSGDVTVNGSVFTENGGASINSTTEAFFPPRVTTAEMDLITPTAGASAFNTTFGLPVFANGTEWNTVSTNVSVIGRVVVQNNIPLVGVFNPITTGTFAFYEINGESETPSFINGVWTCPIAGTYQINISGWAFTASSSDSQCRVYVSVNGLDYTQVQYPGIDQVTKNGAGLAVNGIVKLNNGDAVQIAYSVLSGTNWELDNFRWDISRVGS